MKNNFYRRGNADVYGLGVLIFVGLIIAFVLWIFGFNFGVNNEGTVSYGDCRQTIILNQGDFQTYFHSFTCNTQKTESGAVMGGECVSIVNDHTLFSSSHTCATAYVYEIKPSTICKDDVKNGVPYPYLGYNDMCYTTPQ